MGNCRDTILIATAAYAVGIASLGGAAIGLLAAVGGVAVGYNAVGATGDSYDGKSQIRVSPILTFRCGMS
jgi:hypothetical protein